MSCPSEFQLNTYAAGQLSPDQQMTFQSHIESCESCKLRVDALADLFETVTEAPGIARQIADTNVDIWPRVREALAADGTLTLSPSLLTQSRLPDLDDAYILYLGNALNTRACRKAANLVREHAVCLLDF